MKTMSSMMASLALALTLNVASGNDQVTQTATVRGEVIEMECYLANGAHGSSHAACARKCIEAGLPAGIKTQPGQIYLLIGKRELLSAQFAPLAGKIVTVSGQYATRDGVFALENPQLVKQ